MARIIKFRAWATKECRAYKPETMWDWEIIFSELKSEPRFLDMLFDGKKFIILQFIGLLDKNGKEIYEGDIIKSGNYEGGIYEVKYDDSGFSPFAETYFGDDLIQNELCEIVGNVFENPELLKK